MLFAGLDIGTDGVRIVVTDDKLNVEYTNSVKYHTVSPREGWAEQDPDEIFHAVTDILNEAGTKLHDYEFYVVFSSTMHNIMGMDINGKAITPLIIWADTRARGEKLYLEKIFGGMPYKYTGCPVHSTYWPPKILWLKKYYGDKIDRFVSIKEYIINKLTGKWLTDISVASTSGIFNIYEKCYDRNIMNILGITERNLSKTVNVGYSFDFVLGKKNFKGIIGATDGAFSNLGVGAVNRDSVVLTVGSSSAVRYLDSKVTIDEKGRTWCYAVDDGLYAVGEATNSAGLVLNWSAAVLGYDSSEDMLSKCIRKIPYRQNDIIFIPTLTGERAPGYNESLRGFLYGISLNHTKDDIAVSAFEGILFFLKMIYEDVIRVRGDLPKKKIVTGGLGLSDTFLTLLSYLIDDVGFMPGHEQNTAIGACMMGIKNTLGMDYEDMSSYLPEIKTKYIDFNDEFRNYLVSKYDRFKSIYKLLSEKYDLFNGEEREANFNV